MGKGEGDGRERKVRKGKEEPRAKEEREKVGRERGKIEKG